MKIPEWAETMKILEAIKKAARIVLILKKIFGEFSSCNVDMEKIFGDQKTEMKKDCDKQSSSEDWTNDELNAHEKQAYKRNMGYR